ncbi:hypothetical protein MLD38_017678 [Melastoma candidum]|uniref:Uncharacterized protein n=1 Tax=Melastoma candidum TaxID=119954 RepID=A0ACB9QTA8_9MYRT|nr:hypothetical protein MLD38_017678 [Melastoma candidum]
MEQPHRHRHQKNSSSSRPPPPRWWTKETIAIVTGANKGIGFALVKKLACLGITVILTCRNPERGMEAVVNNAAVAFNEVNGNSVDSAETVINTNYQGTKRLTQALLPFFRRSSTVSRILNVTSRLGHINKLKNSRFVAMLQGEGLSEAEVDAMVFSFLSDMKDGTWRVKGWPEVWTDYAVSKLALNSYSKILAKRNVGFGLSVNCYCPGFTRTSMTGGVGKRTADEAAATTAMIVLLQPEELPTGVFFAGCDPVINSRL